ncbi:MAG: STAS domain-containing protein [Spirochaetota bacterium]
MLYISHTQANGSTAIVFARGPLHNSTSDEFESYISQIVDDGIKSVIFDSASVDYISSTGIGALLYVNRKLISNNGKFILCNVPENIISILKIIKLDNVLNIVSSQEDAIEAIDKTPVQARDDAATSPPADEPDFQEPQEEFLEVLDRDDLTSDDIMVDHAPSLESKASDETKTSAPLETTVNMNSLFPHPIIVECAECRSLLRVSYPGTFLCPDCNTEFMVEEDRTIIF